MADRDEWFAIHTSDEPEKSLTKPGPASGGFRVDPDAAPAMRAGFERAIEKMQLALNVATQFDSMRGQTVNPVVDKYMAAVIERATGDEGSVTSAAASAVVEYQNVLEQLDSAMAGYRADDDSAEHALRNQS